MQTEQKKSGVYVQMPKENEAERLLAELVDALSCSDRKKPKSYYAAVEYLERKGIVSETEV